MAAVWLQAEPGRSGPGPGLPLLQPGQRQLIVHACVGTIASIAFKDCAKIKKVTFKHTVSNS